MQKFIISVILLMFSVVLNAQDIKRINADFSDYTPLLKAAGFEVFAYDISSLMDDTYMISLVVKEYVNGDLVNDSESNQQRAIIPNREMLNDLSPAKRRAVIERGDVYDAEKGIYRLAKKVSIGFSPKTDSLKNVHLTVDSMGAITRVLSLKPSAAPLFNGDYFYDIRTLKIEKLSVDGVTPLMLLGSFWYDENLKALSFFGDDESSLDIASPILKQIPHCYVIGIKVEKLFKSFKATPKGSGGATRPRGTCV